MDISFPLKLGKFEYAFFQNDMERIYITAKEIYINTELVFSDNYI